MYLFLLLMHFLTEGQIELSETSHMIKAKHAFKYFAESGLNPYISLHEELSRESWSELGVSSSES